MDLIKVFISYSYENDNKRKTIEKLIKESNVLEPIVVANKRQSGRTLEAKVKDGINTSKYFVPILTPESIGNQWVNQEIGYATAKEIPILPIVDSSVSNILKGFVHNQKDLSCRFATTGEPTTDRRKFRKAAAELVQEIMLREAPENNEYVKPHMQTMPDMAGLFRGIWQCSYRNKEASGIDRPIRIKNDEYFINNQKKFRITGFFLNGMQTMFKYTKNGFYEDKRVIRGRMEIIDLYQHYEGEETNSETGKWSVIYKRIK